MTNYVYLVLVPLLCCSFNGYLKTSCDQTKCMVQNGKVWLFLFCCFGGSLHTYKSVGEKGLSIVKDIIHGVIVLYSQILLSLLCSSAFVRTSALTMEIRMAARFLTNFSLL